jgi:hypothetical protein
MFSHLIFELHFSICHVYSFFWSLIYVILSKQVNLIWENLTCWIQSCCKFGTKMQAMLKFLKFFCLLKFWLNAHMFLSSIIGLRTWERAPCSSSLQKSLPFTMWTIIMVHLNYHDTFSNFHHSFVPFDLIGWLCVVVGIDASWISMIFILPMSFSSITTMQVSFVPHNGVLFSSSHTSTQWNKSFNINQQWMKGRLYISNVSICTSPNFANSVFDIDSKFAKCLDSLKIAYELHNVIFYIILLLQWSC